MPILTFKVYGLTKFEIDIFNVLIAQCALFPNCYHLAFHKLFCTQLRAYLRGLYH